MRRSVTSHTGATGAAGATDAVGAEGSRQVRIILGALVIGLVLAATPAAQEFPAPKGKVNDFANLLKPEDRATLEEVVAEVERDTTAEIAVVTVATLGGKPVEEYANRLFSEWGIGKKGRDNGVLILIARDDREMRIEVGYGLEGVLPDGLAGAITRETAWRCSWGCSARR